MTARLAVARVGLGLAAAAARAAVLGVCACTEAPLSTLPVAPGPPVCPLEGCTRAERADVDAPGVAGCPAARLGSCAGLGPSACTDEALADWGAPGGARALGCIARRLSESCGAGEVRACGFAGRLLLDGKGLAADVGRGLELLHLACDGGVPLACLAGARFLGDQGAAAGGESADEAHRFEMVYACLSGQGEACAQVGALFRVGEEGFPRDYRRAVASYVRGCDLGESRSCNNLGDALAYGEGAERDLDRAVEAFDKACHLGEALGCANLAFRLERGLGVARDLGRARALYRDACNVGQGYACLHLELLTAEGARGQDPARRVSRWKRACEGARDGRACALLGLIYDDGPDGVTRDEAKSLAAMGRGCDLGEPRACDWVRMHSED